MTLLPRDLDGNTQGLIDHLQARVEELVAQRTALELQHQQVTAAWQRATVGAVRALAAERGDPDTETVTFGVPPVDEQWNVNLRIDGETCTVEFLEQPATAEQ